jgi:hypothetical protein
MSGEMQSCMQSLRVPVVKLQRAEKIYPGILNEGVVSALCRGSHFIVLFPGFMWQKKSKYFLGSLCWILHFP